MDYYDLGPFGRTVTTASQEAQRWFDRGLNWTYAYNHEEAVACFEKAIAADPSCAMAHWGVAYASGPNYNYPWHLRDPAGLAADLASAYDATLKALSHAQGITAVEQALIRALPARYPQRDPIGDPMPWNQDFTNAMRDVLGSHPEDPEVQTIFVEAILNETPWKMWDLKTGGIAAGAGTLEARKVLEGAFNDFPASWDQILAELGYKRKSFRRNWRRNDGQQNHW